MRRGLWRLNLVDVRPSGVQLLIIMMLFRLPMRNLMILLLTLSFIVRSRLSAVRSILFRMILNFCLLLLS